MMNDPQPAPPTDQPVPEISAADIVQPPSVVLGEAPVETDSPQQRLADFHRTLLELTPRVYVTPVLIGINALVFILMVISGVSLVTPTIPDLLRWGANFGPQTSGGEWWRLLSCVFVHIGIIHILLNMWVLATAGPLVERMLGNVGFLLMYLVAGLCGSLASILWNPMLVSAGASGAIFGVYGALLALLLRDYGSIPPEPLTQLRGSGVGFLAYNLLFGMMQPNIDNAAHIGGLVGGFLSGLVLSQPFTPSARALRPLRNALLVGAGSLAVFAGVLSVHSRHSDLAKVQTELDQFVEVEKRSLDRFNEAVSKAQRGQLSPPAFADLIEREVLPEWRAARERLAALSNIPAPLQKHVSAVLDYMRLRQEGWEQFAPALREDDNAKMQQAIAMQRRADEAAQRMNSGK